MERKQAFLDAYANLCCDYECVVDVGHGEPYIYEQGEEGVAAHIKALRDRMDADSGQLGG